MKKIHLVFLLIALLLGCSSTGTVSHIDEKSLKVKLGDSKSRVQEIFGKIGHRSFNGNREVWQYCTTGFSSDKYVFIWFVDEEVISVTTRNGYSSGICNEHFFTIDWS